MSKKNKLIFGVMLALLFVIVALILVFSAYKEKYENTNTKPVWYDNITEYFFYLLNRPIDDVHYVYYKNITNNLPLAKAISVIKDDLKLYTEGVNKGSRKARKSKIVIAGLIQNSAYEIPQLKERCRKIVSQFKDYRIVILENNSTDSTREYLLNWAKIDPKVKILCHDAYVTNLEECNIVDVAITNDHSPMPHRIQKMATFRNIYMDHIHHYYDDFDYLCVMDMDLQGEVYIDGMLHTISLLEPNIDGMTCNGMLIRDPDTFYYYDSFAHIEEHEPGYITDIASKSEHDVHVHIYMTQLYSSQMTPDRVRSAFGGLAIYNMKNVIKQRYNYSQTNFVCEHTFFHHNKRIYVNPRMIFLITKNG